MNSMQIVISQLDLQTRLFKNATTGYSEADASTTSGEANHVKWLTGHVVSTRYMMANVVGITEQEPYPDLFAQGKGRQPDAEYPAMTDLVKDWDGISQKLIDRLNQMSDEDFNAAPPFPLPMGDGTLKGFVGFLSHHEAYTIGQIAYARRIFGMESMKYN